MKKGKKISVLQLFRLLLQVVFFAFLPALYIGAFNGVKQIYLAVIHQSFSSATISQLIEVIAILPVTILLGRFFAAGCARLGLTAILFTSFLKSCFTANGRSANRQTDG